MRFTTFTVTPTAWTAVYRRDRVHNAFGFARCARVPTGRTFTPFARLPPHLIDSAFADCRAPRAHTRTLPTHLYSDYQLPQFCVRFGYTAVTVRSSHATTYRCLDTPARRTRFATRTLLRYDTACVHTRCRLCLPGCCSYWFTHTCSSTVGSYPIQYTTAAVPVALFCHHYPWFWFTCVCVHTDTTHFAPFTLPSARSRLYAFTVYARYATRTHARSTLLRFGSPLPAWFCHRLRVHRVCLGLPPHYTQTTFHCYAASSLLPRTLPVRYTPRLPAVILVYTTYAHTTACAYVGWFSSLHAGSLPTAFRFVLRRRAAFTTAPATPLGCCAHGLPGLPFVHFNAFRVARSRTFDYRSRSVAQLPAAFTLRAEHHALRGCYLPFSAMVPVRMVFRWIGYTPGYVPSSGFAPYLFVLTRSGYLLLLPLDFVRTGFPHGFNTPLRVYTPRTPHNAARHYLPRCVWMPAFAAALLRYCGCRVCYGLPQRIPRGSLRLRLDVTILVCHTTYRISHSTVCGRLPGSHPRFYAADTMRHGLQLPPIGCWLPIFTCLVWFWILVRAAARLHLPFRAMLPYG